MAAKTDDCTICLCPMTDVASIACMHTFCFNCILNWSKVTNLCPVCKTEFKQIKSAEPTAPADENETGPAKKGRKRKADGDAQSNSRSKRATTKPRTVRVAKRTQRVAYEDTGFANPNVMNNDDDDDTDSDFDDAFFGTYMAMCW